MMGVRTGRTMSRSGKLPCDVMNDVEGAKKVRKELAIWKRGVGEEK